jgi:hypothetical protein
MISRLSTCAAAFAILATATLTYATSARTAGPALAVDGQATRVIQLDPVVVTATRRPHAAH